MFTPMILVVDNYDSFTYNLAQYLGELGAEQKIVRNDELTLDEIAALRPDRILVSPGPCAPAQAGLSNDIIRRFGPTIPTLGVCLGHQCLGEVFGGDVVRADAPMHGKTSMIHHHGRGVFRGLPNPFRATRYHSLVVKKATLPACLEVEAWTDDGTIMGLSHKEHPIWGVQFHPESILTEAGMRLLGNFLELKAPAVA